MMSGEKHERISVTDTDTTGATQGQENLTALRMADLRAIASGKGIRGISAMRKHELIAAIQGSGSGQAPAKAAKPAKDAGKEAAEGTARSEGKGSGSAGRDDDSSTAR